LEADLLACLRDRRNKKTPAPNKQALVPWSKLLTYFQVFQDRKYVLIGVTQSVKTPKHDGAFK